MIFGRLTVVALSKKDGFVICQCECGTQKEIRASSLTKSYKPTQSCGCFQKEVAKEFCKELGKMSTRKKTNKVIPLEPTIAKNNTSGFKGVSYNKNIGKYHAYINLNKKRVHLGTYDTAEEAANIRKEIEKRYSDCLRKKPYIIPENIILENKTSC